MREGQKLQKKFTEANEVRQERDYLKQEIMSCLWFVELEQTEVNKLT